MSEYNLTWVALIVITGIIKLLTSPPSALVAWIVSKFALHPKLDSKDVTVTFNGKHLKEEENIKFIDYFNKACFLKRYDIFPGNEKSFLHPETNVTPFVINLKKGKRDVNFFIYNYDNHVDVVKQYKEKIVSYSISSEHLQKFSTPTL
ncbi:YfmQ family protein [Bacillus sp. FJAT-52991]|uniref:YfmQ family protein n=1 Tax=Bacillus kandeliae TaxID=3129297 RepID=A0ABZ2N6P8_9BACI